MSIKLSIGDSFHNFKPISTQLIKFQNTKYHCHDFIEFFYVVDGKATHYLNEKRFTIKRGDAFLLLPDDSHSFEDGNELFLHRDIMIKTDFFKSICDQYSPTLFDEILSRKYPTHIEIDNYSEAGLEKLSENFEMSVINSTELLEKQIVYEIIGYFLFSKSYKNNNSTIARLAKILSSPDYYKYTINEILALEKLGYCREHICRTFKKIIGITMTSFFNKNKIEYAIILKQTGFYTMAEIRKIINIENESYFYKLLKKNTKSNT